MAVSVRRALFFLLCVVPAILLPASAQQPATSPANPAPAGQSANGSEITPRERLALGPREQLKAKGWLETVKQPLPWITFGGDLRMREQWTDNMVLLDKHAPGHEQHYQRYRTRLWTQIRPADDLEFNARIVWEFFNYCLPEGLRDTNLDEAIIDQLNVRWTKTLGLPNTLKLGRQDIIDLGGGWLIMDGTPLDGSRTFFFDAVRDTYEFKDIKSSLDLIYINNAVDQNDRIPPFNGRDAFHPGWRPLAEQDESGAVAWFKNRSLKSTNLDGYFIWKHDRRVLVNGDQGNVYALGGRVEHDFTEHWSGWAEMAQELGHKNGQDLVAMGARTLLAYNFRDEWQQQLRGGYEYLSGNDPDTSTNEQFDPLWGRWARFSDLLGFTYASETRSYEFTNLHRLHFGWAGTPSKRIELSLDYNVLFAAEDYHNRPGFSNTNLFRGQLITTWLRYKFTEHISGHIMFETFFPGDFYTDARNDVAFFTRYELTFSW